METLTYILEWVFGLIGLIIFAPILLWAYIGGELLGMKRCTDIDE